MLKLIIIYSIAVYHWLMPYDVENCYRLMPYFVETYHWFVSYSVDYMMLFFKPYYVEAYQWIWYNIGENVVIVNVTLC